IALQSWDLIVELWFFLQVPPTQARENQWHIINLVLRRPLHVFAHYIPVEIFHFVTTYRPWHNDICLFDQCMQCRVGFGVSVQRTPVIWDPQHDGNFLLSSFQFIYKLIYILDRISTIITKADAPKGHQGFSIMPQVSWISLLIIKLVGLNQFFPVLFQCGKVFWT